MLKRTKVINSRESFKEAVQYGLMQTLATMTMTNEVVNEIARLLELSSNSGDPFYQDMMNELLKPERNDPKLKEAIAILLEDGDIKFTSNQFTRLLEILDSTALINKAFQSQRSNIAMKETEKWIMSATQDKKFQDIKKLYNALDENNKKYLIKEIIEQSLHFSKQSPQAIIGLLSDLPQAFTPEVFAHALQYTEKRDLISVIEQAKRLVDKSNWGKFAEKALAKVEIQYSGNIAKIILGLEKPSADKMIKIVKEKQLDVNDVNGLFDIYLSHNKPLKDLGIEFIENIGELWRKDYTDRVINGIISAIVSDIPDRLTVMQNLLSKGKQPSAIRALYIYGGIDLKAIKSVKQLEQLLDAMAINTEELSKTMEAIALISEDNAKIVGKWAVDEKKFDALKTVMEHLVLGNKEIVRGIKIGTVKSLINEYIRGKFTYEPVFELLGSDISGDFYENLFGDKGTLLAVFLSSLDKENFGQARLFIATLVEKIKNSVQGKWNSYLEKEFLGQTAAQMLESLGMEKKEVKATLKI